jgi:hypothetical protein
MVNGKAAIAGTRNVLAGAGGMLCASHKASVAAAVHTGTINISRGIGHAVSGAV